MRLPMMARYRISLLSALVLASTLLTGCAGESTAPNARTMSSQLVTSPFVPTDAQKALVGASDGTYSFAIDPTRDQVLAIGASQLFIPANAICDLATSSYGTSHWNDSCSQQSEALTITAVVKNAATDHPSIDFQPAMRFSPNKSVNLYIVASNQATVDASRVMKYCGATSCVDESVSDADLRSFVDVENKVVFRRIKHFSGYVIAQLTETVENALGY